MPSPPFIRNMALSALLLGVSFLAANLYLDATGYPKLANLFFMLGILSNTAFAGLAVLWGLCSAWVNEAQRPGAPMPGAKPGPAAPVPGAAPRAITIAPGAMPGAATPVPGVTADKKPRPPQG
jgi:hypothetical protein